MARNPRFLLTFARHMRVSELKDAKLLSIIDTFNITFGFAHITAFPLQSVIQRQSATLKVNSRSNPFTSNGI